eukprot:bmy_18410T0
MRNDSKREESNNESEMSTSELRLGYDNDDFDLPSKTLASTFKILSTNETGAPSPALKHTDEQKTEDPKPTQTLINAPPETLQSPHLILKDITNVNLSPVVKNQKIKSFSKKE